MDKHSALAFLYTCSRELFSLVWDLREQFDVPQTADLYNLPLRIEEARDTLAAGFEPEQLTLFKEDDDG